MSRKQNPHSQIIHILQELHIAYPEYNMGKHLATALDGHDVWGITDRELHSSLVIYKSQLDMDISHTDENELDEILKDGQDLDNILKEETEHGDY
jgi:hypothetical protein